MRRDVSQLLGSGRLLTTNIDTAKWGLMWSEVRKMNELWWELTTDKSWMNPRCHQHIQISWCSWERNLLIWSLSHLISQRERSLYGVIQPPPDTGSSLTRSEAATSDFSRPAQGSLIPSQHHPGLLTRGRGTSPTFHYHFKEELADWLWPYCCPETCLVVLLIPVNRTAS